MKNAYLAICYVCNERCRYCPCSSSDKSTYSFTDYGRLIEKTDEFIADGITEVTISGGEPTLHPRLADLLSYIQGHGIKVTLLSNGEMFSKEEYRTVFLDAIDPEKLRLITTIHSHLAGEHDDANLTPGSFDRTVSGLVRMREGGVKVIVKHCITKANYTDIDKFIAFVHETFDPTVDIQLCSIDYFGIPEDKLDGERLTFSELRPYLEKGFDHYEQNCAGRRLYCINIPLCSCDPYYWKYLPRRRKHMYDSYSDPKLGSVVRGSDNVGVSPEYCKNCRVNELCAGTYTTAFKCFGGIMVSPI